MRRAGGNKERGLIEDHAVGGGLGGEHYGQRKRGWEKSKAAPRGLDEPANMTYPYGQ